MTETKQHIREFLSNARDLLSSETKQVINEYLSTDIRDIRAVSTTDKQEVILRIFAAWLKVPQLRLGQLLTAAISPKRDAFSVEDWQLVEAVERLAEK